MILKQMNIKPTYIISGKLYLKFIEDYKRYDQRQKDLIHKLRKKIEFLEWNIEDLKAEIDELNAEIDDLEDCSNVRLRQKLKNQRTALREYCKKIEKQQNEIEELTNSNQVLREEIEKLRN